MYEGKKKFSVYKNKIEIYEKESVEKSRDKYFKKDDVAYIVHDDSAFVIYNPRFYADSVAGDIVKLHTHEIGKNLIVKESKNWTVLNFFNDVDGYEPIITVIEKDFLYIYMISDKVTDALKENKKDKSIIKNITSKDIDGYLVNKGGNLNLIGILDIKNKKVNYWNN